MAKQVLEVDANDFAKVISCVGYTLTLLGLSLPDGRQKELALGMGDDLIDVMLKYSNDDKRKKLENLREVLLTSEADTSVSN